MKCFVPFMSYNRMLLTESSELPFSFSETSRNASDLVHANFNKRHEVSSCSFT